MPETVTELPVNPTESDNLAAESAVENVIAGNITYTDLPPVKAKEHLLTAGMDAGEDGFSPNNIVWYTDTHSEDIEEQDVDLQGTETYTGHISGFNFHGFSEYIGSGGSSGGGSSGGGSSGGGSSGGVSSGGGSSGGDGNGDDQDENIPDIGNVESSSVDFQPIKDAFNGLGSKVPFVYVSKISDIIGQFGHSPITPNWDWQIFGQTINISFDNFDNFAKFWRWAVSLLLIFGTGILMTRKWGE